MKIHVRHAALLTAVISCLVFLQVLNNQFVDWDDAQQIYQNSHLTAINAEFFSWAFLEQYWLLWMPLTWLSFAIDYQLWGMNPFGFHLTSLLLHGLNTLFVALLTVQLVKLALRGKDKGLERDSIIFCALVGGLLFALHPLKAEPVAWATDRKGLLNAAFAIPSLIAYLRFAGCQAEHPNPLAARLHNRSYLTALLLFLLSLLCKPMSVTLPVIMILLDRFPLKRFAQQQNRHELFLEKIPFFVGSGIVSLITIYLKPISDISFSEITFWSRLHVACRSLIEYLRLMVLPNDLMALYDHPGNSVALLSWQYIWPILLVVLITAGCIYRARSDKSWLTVWLCYVTLLLPVLGFSQNGGQAMADRFMYLPGIGLTILIAAGCTHLYQRQKTSGPGRAALIVSIIAVLATYAVVTQGLIKSWHDTDSLWTHAITVRPHQAGRAYYQRGLYRLVQGDYPQAAADASRSLEILSGIGYTRIAKVYSLRAEAYEKMGMADEAASDMAKVNSLPSPWKAQRLQ
jgi:accessory gene regulator protein AgrB